MERLNSWKEIAAFFGKDVRTVRRWEGSRGLPVHRVPGGGRSSVFAYVAELEVWLARVDTAEPEVEITTLPTPEPPAEDLESPRVSTAGSNFASKFEPEADLGDDSAPDAPPAARLAINALSGPGGDTPARPGAALFSVPTPAAAPAAAPALLETGAPGPHEVARLPLFRRYTLIAPVVVTLIAASIFAVRQKHVAPAQPPSPSTGKGLETSSSLSSDPEAREFYLRGRYQWNQRTEGSITRAAELFTQAIQRDPHFAAAYAGLADSYIFLRQYGHMTDQEAFPRALLASGQALELDDTSPEAHRTYAFLLNYWLWNFPAAEREFKRSLELRPSDPQTHHWYATSLYSAGRYEDGLREIDEARRLQPDSASINANRGLLLAALNQNSALEYLLQIERDCPDFPPVHRYLGERYAALGDYKDFLVQFERFSVLRDDLASAEIYERAQAELEAHGSQAMLRLLGESFGDLAENSKGDAMLPAFFYAKLGNKERTLFYMRLAGQRHDADFLTMNGEPAFSLVYGTPEYKALLLMRKQPVSVTDPRQGLKLVQSR